MTTETIVRAFTNQMELCYNKCRMAKVGGNKEMASYWQGQVDAYSNSISLVERVSAPIDDGMFRDLDVEEVLDFQRWARDHYVSGTTISTAWHPVVQAECALINAEDEAELARDIFGHRADHEAEGHAIADKMEEQIRRLGGLGGQR